MWIAILGGFVLVTVMFGHSQHRESSDGSSHHQPAVSQVAEQVEPGSVPRAEGMPVTYKRD
jgi:hypothetical protein